MSTTSHGRTGTYLGSCLRIGYLAVAGTDVGRARVHRILLNQGPVKVWIEKERVVAFASLPQHSILLATLLLLSLQLLLSFFWKHAQGVEQALLSSMEDVLVAPTLYVDLSSSNREKEKV